MYNGIKEDGKLHAAHYSLSCSQDSNPLQRTITIYARGYMPLPNVPGLTTVNESNGITDYFEKDHIKVAPDNAFYPQVLEAYNKQEAKYNRPTYTPEPTPEPVVVVETPAIATNLIQAERIVILWSESNLVSSSMEFKTFAGVNHMLERIAQDNSDGCLKTAFTIYYPDGEEYTGRIDVTFESKDIVKHVRDFVEYSAGVRKPAHMTEESYQAYINATGGAAQQEKFMKFLNTYQIGDTAETTPPPLNVVQLNPHDPASPKQLWALHCITKLDTRDWILSKMEASKLIGRAKMGMDIFQFVGQIERAAR